MYIPQHFAETDVATMHALMREFPLATLVTQNPEGLDANSVPLFLDGRSGPHGTLRGHIARANPLSGGAALAIFHGPQCYISPSGYATKAATGKVVPTWNYVTVHAHGELRLIDDPTWILAQMTALTVAQETGLPQPWAVSDAPADYIEKMLGAVIGVEIVISRLAGKWKASQNQSAVNRESLISALAGMGEPMAGVIRGRDVDE